MKGVIGRTSTLSATNITKSNLEAQIETLRDMQKFAVQERATLQNEYAEAVEAGNEKVVDSLTRQMAYNKAEEAELKGEIAGLVCAVSHIEALAKYIEEKL